MNLTILDYFFDKNKLDIKKQDYTFIRWEFLQKYFFYFMNIFDSLAEYACVSCVT